MKKVIIALLLVLTLAACSTSNNAKITDGDTVIWEADKQKYTAQDLFDSVKANDYSAFIVNDALVKIGTLMGLDIESFKEEGKAQWESYVNSGLESYLVYYYLNEENFVSSYAANSVVEEVINKKIEDNFDQYVTENAPFKAEIVYFDDKETADKVIEEFAKGKKTFAEICTENGYADAIEETVYLDNDENLTIEVKETVASMTEPGVSQVIISSTVITDADGESYPSPRYYIVNLISNDANDFKDDFISLISQDFESDTVINDLFVEYNFECHDQRTYELIHESYPGVK